VHRVKGEFWKLLLSTNSARLRNVDLLWARSDMKSDWCCSCSRNDFFLVPFWLNATIITCFRYSKGQLGLIGLLRTEERHKLNGYHGTKYWQNTSTDCPQWNYWQVPASSQAVTLVRAAPYSWLRHALSPSQSHSPSSESRFFISCRSSSLPKKARWISIVPLLLQSFPLPAPWFFRSWLALSALDFIHLSRSSLALWASCDSYACRAILRMPTCAWWWKPKRSWSQMTRELGRACWKPGRGSSYNDENIGTWKVSWKEDMWM